MEKYWLSAPPPTNCDICHKAIVSQFTDGKTNGGPWAIMCKACFPRHSLANKLGTGLGQQYTKQTDGRWLKTGG